MTTNLKVLKERFMEVSEFPKEYARGDEGYAPARRFGTTQSAPAQLESGRAPISFATLRRCAEATSTRLTVSLVRPDS